ncbi:MAG: tetratricopeptide repeat protein [Flavobacteriales bacterium]|nr:tetratricopeptide repeat protein [Flavobacteriales bacterium]
MKNLLSLVLVLLVQINLLAQDKLDKFWGYFQENNYPSAIEELESIVSSDPSNEDAWALLALVYDDQMDSYKAFQSFRSLYDLTDRKTEYLQAFWHTSAVNSYEDVQRKERIAFFEKILADPSVDGSIKAMAHGSIGNYYYRDGDFDAYWEQMANVGNFNLWQVVGTFENISASGFDKEHSPLTQPSTSARFRNKREAEVYWFESNDFRVGEWIRTGYHFDTDNSIVYAQTYVNSPSDQNAQLRVGTSGSLKAWMNDKLLISVEEEYNNGVDTYRSSVSLKKGWNRILIQVGSSEISSQNFMVRITDEKGAPLSNLTHSNKNQSYAKVGGEDLTMIPSAGEVYFEERVKNNPENLLDQLLLSRLYLDNGKTNQAHSTLKDAEELAPNSSLILWELLELYLQEGNDTELGVAAEKIKVVDPQNRFSLALQFNEALSNEDYDKAEDLLNQLDEVRGEGAGSLEDRIELESSRGNNQKVIDLALEGYAKYPKNETFLRLKYVIELNVNQNPAAAQKVLKKFLKKNYSEGIKKLYASSCAERNNVTEFFAQYNDILELTPYSIGDMIDLADIYYQIKQYDQALRYLDQALELAPFVGSLYSQKGQVLMDMGNESEALKNYQMAVKFDPTDFTARERIRTLEGEKSLFDNWEEKDYYKIYEEAPDAADYPEDNSLIVTEEKQIVIHEKGAVEERNYMVVKVFDKAGVDFWKEYAIPRFGSQYLILEKAEVLKKDGSKNPAETSGSYVVFTNLEPGDGIYLAYRLQNYYQGNLSEHFWGKQYFDYFVPAKNIEFSILYDEEETPLEFKVSNGEIEKSEKEIGAMKMVEFSAKDVESIKSESFMPALTDIGRVLHYSSMPDWDFVSDWYSDLAATKARVDYEVKAIVNDLFPDGWEGVSDEEKVSKVYEYIVNEIRYSSISFRQSGLVPQKASKVLITKIGDCKDVSTLFVAMCEELGVDANLVLVNTRKNGQHAMDLPSIDFNHCIAKVDLNGEEQFVELTTDLYAFATVSPSLQGSFILEIDEDGEKNEPRLLPANKNKPNAIYRKSEATLKKNTMVVDKESIKTGSVGAGMRSIYRDIGEEERRKEMQEAISGEYANIKLNHVKFGESLENNTDSVEYQYGYTVSNPFTKIGSLEIVKVPLADNLKPIEFLSAEERKYGVELWRYFRYTVAEEEMFVAFEDGRKLTEVPEDVMISNELLDYKLTFKMQDGKLRIYRRIEFKTTKIELKDFELFKTAMEEVITADNLQIGLN